MKSTIETTAAWESARKLEVVVNEASEAGAITDSEFSYYQKFWDVPPKTEVPDGKKCDKLAFEVVKKHAVYLHMQQSEGTQSEKTIPAQTPNTVFTNSFNGDQFDVAGLLDFFQSWSTPKELAVILDTAMEALTRYYLTDNEIQPGPKQEEVLSHLRQLRNHFLKGAGIIDLGVW